MTNWYDKVLNEVGEEAPAPAPVAYSIADEDVDPSPISAPDTSPVPASTASNWYSDILQKVGEDEIKTNEDHEPSLRQVLQPKALFETGKHLGVGALSFPLSIASGFGELIRQKSLNVARSFVKGTYPDDEYAFKRKLEETKIPEARQSLIDNRRLVKEISMRRKLGDYKSSEEIRELVNEASGIWSGLLDPPKTEGGKVSLRLAEIIMHDMLFYYPRQADKWLSEKGFHNLGWLIGVAGELTSIKMMHSSAKAVKKIPKDYMRFLDDLDLKIPEGEHLSVISKSTITKAEKIVNNYLDDIGVPKDKTISPEALLEYVKKTYKKSPEDALKRPTKRQKIEGHELARKAGLNEQQRRIIAEEITGERSMTDMNRQSAGEFIKSIKNIIKEKKAEPKKAKIEIEPESVKPEIKPEIKIPEDVKNAIIDDMQVVKDMGVYAEIRELLGKQKDADSIMKILEKGEFFKEDLKDFKYTKADIRESINAIKADMGDNAILKQRENTLKRESTAVEKIEQKAEIREIEIPSDIERVDPIKGRSSGAIADLTPSPRQKTDIELAFIKSRLPIRSNTGKILRSKIAARNRAGELGHEGEMIKNPEGDGWYVKRSKEQRKKTEEVEKKAWEDLLKEEETKISDYSKQEVGFIPSILKNETGSITIDLSAIKKIRETIKKGKISKEEMIKGLISRGASPDDLLKVFPEISVREMNVVEQKPSVRKTNEVKQTSWLKVGQDPKELLPGRKIGGKRKAPAVSREDAQMIATTTDLKRPGSEGLKKAPIGEKVRIFATSEGVFTRIGKPLREAFYRRAITSHKKASDYAKKLLTESRKIQKTFKLGSRELHSKRIDIYSIAQQPDGIARLRLQGIKKIPKLTKKEKIAYNKLQLMYKDLFVKINKAREAVGQKKFEAVDNYSAWAHDMQKLNNIERISAFDKMEKVQIGLERIRNIPSQIDKLGRTLSLKGHEKLRAGPDLPGYLILDAFENFNVYAKIAADTIHKSHDIAYMHELLNSQFKLSENAPNTYRFLSEWLDFQKGHEPVLFIENPKARRLMRTLSSNVAVAYLTYAMRPVLVQLASLNLSYAKLGERFTAEGAVRLLDLRELKRAAKESNVLTTRSPEEILMRAQRVYPFFSGLKGKTISKGVQKVKQTGFKGLFLTDTIVSYLTYLGAEAKGRSLYKKLSEDQKRTISKDEFSRNYADDIVVQCQGSAAASARAPIQRHAEGKFITTLGTFTIANFNFISQHLLGIKNPNITKPQTLAVAMRFVIASTIISSIFEDALNLTSPIPTPIRAFQTAIEKSKSIRKGVQSAAKELLEFIPVYGGKYKFDSELLGSVSDQLVKLGKGDFSTLGRLFGLPGFQALWKAYRAEKTGGTAIDMIMGRYLEPSEKQGSITKSSRKITGGEL